MTTARFEPQRDLFATAGARRDLGIARAEARANRRIPSPEWTAAAAATLSEFLGYRLTPFLAEEFVAWAVKRMAAPPDPRAWGGPIRRAASQGLIRRVGYAPAASSNLSPKCLWEPVRIAP